MSEINKTNKQDIPLGLCFLIILLCILPAFYNQFFGAVFFLVASIIAYYTDSRTKNPFSSVLVFAAGIECYTINVFSTPLFSTICLMTSFAALGCILTNIIFKDNKFFEGLLYSVAFGIVVMLLSSVLYYYLDGEQQLIEASLANLKSYLTNSNSISIQYMMAALSRNIDIIESNAEIMSIFQPIEMQEHSVMVEKSMTFFEIVIREDYATFIVAYPLTVMGITWWLGNKLKYRTQPMTADGPIQKPKPFSTFKYPRWMINAIMLLILVSFFIQLGGGGEITTYISLALQNICLYLIAIQGAAVIDFILKRSRILSSNVIRIIVLLLIIVLFAGIIPLMVGMMDVIIDLRFVYANINKKNNRKI